MRVDLEILMLCLMAALLLIPLGRLLYLKWEDRRIQKEDRNWLHSQVSMGKIDKIELNERGLKVRGTLSEEGKAYLDEGAQWTMPIDLESLEKEIHGNVFEESNLVKHARKELEMLGEDPDVIEWMVRVIGEYSSFGHSGGSHMAILPMLNDLLNFRNLMPLTDDPDEWFDHGEDMGGVHLWQNKRCGSSFSEDGGKTYWDLDRGGKEVIYHSRPHQEPWPYDHDWNDRQGRYYRKGAWPQPRDPKTGRFMKATEGTISLNGD